MRRTRSRARVLRTELLIALVAVLGSALAVASAPRAATPRPALVEIEAAQRSAGNRKPEALQLARALLAHTWPAQVLKVRIDGEGRHTVAGLTLSGVKFHGRLNERSFLDEVAELVDRTFAASDVEEVDVWVNVPIAVGKGAVVAGDYAQPTSRIVFSATLRRADAATDAVVGKLLRGEGVFWDPAWRATLRGR